MASEELPNAMLISDQIITNESSEDAMEDEVFYDDNDDNFKQADTPDIEECIVECTDAFGSLMSNQYNKAVELCDKWSQNSLYHLHTKAILQFMRAFLTLEKAEIEKCSEICIEAQEMCAKYRRSDTYFNSLSKYIFTTNYDTYSDDEVFAEIIYAEQLLEDAIMTFFADQNIISLLKAAFGVRSAYNKYKECMTILETRKTWKNEFIRLNFESTVLLGNGIINIVLSHLPKRITKCLKFLGFSGSRSLGLQQITPKDLNQKNWRLIPMDMFNCLYECYIEQMFGLGKGNVEKVEEIADRNLKSFEGSAWFLWFKGKSLQLRGNIDSAIVVLNQCLNAQNELKPLIIISNWELLWCHAVICDWDSAAKYANLLREQCAWSPASFAYQEAVFLYMKMTEENKLDIKPKVDALLRLVPTLKIRYAGKSIPPEKFACVYAVKYFENNEKLLMPAFELFYIWNIFVVLSGNENLVNPIIERIDKQLNEIKTNDSMISDDNIFEDYLKLLFLKGVCLKEMNKFSEAEKHFLEIMENEKRIKNDNLLAPKTSLELGLTKLCLNSNEEAIIWLEKGRKEYSEYLLETYIHFRIQRALQSIKSEEKLRRKSQKSIKSKAKSINSSNESISKD